MKSIIAFPYFCDDMQFEYLCLFFGHKQRYRFKELNFKLVLLLCLISTSKINQISRENSHNNSMIITISILCHTEAQSIIDLKMESEHLQYICFSSVITSARSDEKKSGRCMWILDDAFSWIYFARVQWMWERADQFDDYNANYKQYLTLHTIRLHIKLLI